MRATNALERSHLALGLIAEIWLSSIEVAIQAALIIRVIILCRLHSLDSSFSARSQSGKIPQRLINRQIAPVRIIKPGPGFFFTAGKKSS
jgi:hypothetical protein